MEKEVRETLITLLFSIKRKQYEQDFNQLLKDLQQLDTRELNHTQLELIQRVLLPHKEENILHVLYDQWISHPFSVWAQSPTFHTIYTYKWQGQSMDVRVSSADFFMGFQNETENEVIVLWKINDTQISRTIPPWGKCLAFENTPLWLNLCICESITIECLDCHGISLLYAWIPNETQHHKTYWTFSHDETKYVYHKGHLLHLTTQNEDKEYYEGRVSIWIPKHRLTQFLFGYNNTVNA